MGGATTHVVALKYGLHRVVGGATGTVGAFSPCFVGGTDSFASHVLRMAMQPSNTLTLLRMPEGFDPQPRDGYAPPSAEQDAGSAAGQPSSSSWAAAVRDCMTTLLGVKGVRLDAASHAEFVRVAAGQGAGGGGRRKGE